MVLQQNEQADGTPESAPLTVTAPVPYAPSGSLRNPFPPIADYAFLSDCENTCLISSAGSVEWLCVPRPDSPSVFGAILDRGAGHFRLGPYGVSVPAARRYLPGSLILETTWQTHTGWVIVRDALVMGPWHDIESRSRTHRRTPMDWDAEHILLRTVRCVSGTVELVMNCEPSFDYHRVSSSWEYSAQAYGEAIARATKNPDSHPTLRLTTNLRIGLEGREARARTRMKEGDNVFVALSWSKHPVPQTYDEAADKLWQTSECWRQWINIGDFPDHPWRSYLQRSALTLKGLTYSPTGALLAAPTTSLPETPQGERNWDYRYAWVRDSTFALWGLYTLGLDREADDFFAFIADVSGANNGERHPLQVMYAVGGERSLVEEELHHLSGYDNARPVRIGNGAYNQMQHDIWGTMLDSVYLHTKSREQIPETLWPVLKQQVEEAIKHWREPDRGIWEVRGEPQHFTSSKIMCWVALDRGSKLAELEGERSYAQQWRATAEEIKADILANGVDSRGVLTQRYGDDALDASLLLAVLTRFLPSDDPRVRATVLAIADELTEEGLVLRYRVEETDDGLSGEEGTFTICSFWLVVRAGRDRRVPPGQAPVRAAAVLRQPAASVRRGDRAAHRTAPGQLPAGVHPPGADQRGGARHPRGGGVRQLGRVPARQRADVARTRLLGGFVDDVDGQGRRLVGEAVCAGPGFGGQIGHHREGVLTSPAVGVLLRRHLGDQAVLRGDVAELPQRAGVFGVHRERRRGALLPYRLGFLEELLGVVRIRVEHRGLFDPVIVVLFGLAGHHVAHGRPPGAVVDGFLGSEHRAQTVGVGHAVGGIGHLVQLAGDLDLRGPHDLVDLIDREQHPVQRRLLQRRHIGRHRFAVPHGGTGDGAYTPG